MMGPDIHDDTKSMRAETASTITTTITIRTPLAKTLEPLSANHMSSFDFIVDTSLQSF
jgi:hypothetical protein